jgi:hypothetical protein
VPDLGLGERIQIGERPGAGAAERCNAVLQCLLFVLAHQHRSQPARSHALLQAAADSRADVRTAKHLFSTRPIFHKLDETVRGHVFCSFLALVQRQLAKGDKALVGNTGYRRSAPRPAASLAIRAAGVALPPFGFGSETRYVCDCFSMAWPILMTLSALTPSLTQRFIPASPL